MCDLVLKNNQNEFFIKSKQFLKLLNKTKISISNDDTRHYLNGVYLHATESNKNTFLTGVATDSHRLSSSSLEINSDKDKVKTLLRNLYDEALSIT